MGLDPYFDDSEEDPDNDGFSNLEEYLYGTDPLDKKDKPQTANCGCNGSASVLTLPLLIFMRRRYD